MTPVPPDDRARPWYLARDAAVWRVHGEGYHVLTGLEGDPPKPFATEADALTFAMAFGLAPSARMANVVHPAVAP